MQDGSIVSWRDRVSFALDVFSKTSFWEGHTFELADVGMVGPFKEENACVLVKRDNGSIASDPRAIDYVVKGFVALSDMLNAEVFLRPGSPVIWIVRVSCG